jgi:hypothetical protein
MENINNMDSQQLGFDDDEEVETSHAGSKRSTPPQPLSSLEKSEAVTSHQAPLSKFKGSGDVSKQLQ